MSDEGNAIRLIVLDEGIVELNINLPDSSVNKFNRQTLAELRQAVDQLKANAELRGVLLSSGKEAFVVGADITEFLGMFREPDEVLLNSNRAVNRIFSDLEDLPVPTVVAINGLALGGGFEVCLSCDFRVLASNAKVGLPETKLGIFPGWGGTVRLPRLIGVDNSVEWIAAGKEHTAEAALKVGVADAVVAPELLREAALDLLKRAISGELDYKARRKPKLEPLKLSIMEQMLAFESCKAVVAQQAGPHYPAPLESVKVMQKAAALDRDKALEVEALGFIKVAKTTVASSLVGLFLNDQELKRKGKAAEKLAHPVKEAAVLGAGIMGGGIAYQSASKGTPILMKDIREEALQLGLKEAAKLLTQKVERGRATPEEMAKALSGIRPTLSYGDFGHTDVVIEAVVENPKVKQAVLAEAEGQVKEGTILASNTSTISISLLAQALKRPEHFCGMHFFNPVHRMPLVEVIRGEKSSPEAIATVVALARKMDKTPIVVNDCPGFLVNRILFPYLGGFTQLVRNGVDFQRVDKLMERFGWPMGPAYLLDVVGIDTAVHARDVMAAGFPDRMQESGPSALDALYQAKRLGQKNGQGFYAYSADKRGKPLKSVDASVTVLLEPVMTARHDWTDEDIIHLMMLPLCLEAVRCLEDGIVETAAEVDMGLIYGIGFPPFHGGALRYIDTLGVANFVALADRYAAQGPLYQPTAKLRERAAAGQSFYG
ncbi:3-hydroxyacyl-CoA dehydrogenase/enoyl-CoA hydratase/3-hydroxybutyryl-CoA epimerase/enoyl-CoA isomerase [Azomonas agilis]|uniref:enoyl-CoA hydratase n=1 Tax=Azomonas agilis TaxID=116849 RepID=A0A562J1Y5_9GAMM|nr:fatty acid oxidation complex subunit alpha FadB [Azomonas agilis]TWH77120.1 3-hydroxyacyl-CoA dehydrogenase/enoyl-CoA hydratase/3-hydroxybutyryl-CoA epimerase/enoyl-CoA isomerase [Azomonas agilis]